MTYISDARGRASYGLALGQLGPLNLLTNDQAYFTTSSVWAASSTFFNNTGATVTRELNHADGFPNVPSMLVVSPTSLDYQGAAMSSLISAANGNAILPSTAYTFKAYVRRISGSGNIGLWARDSANALNGTTTTQAPAVGAWAVLSTTITTGATTPTLLLSVSGRSSGGTATTYLVAWAALLRA